MIYCFLFGRSGARNAFATDSLEPACKFGARPLGSRFTVAHCDPQTVTRAHIVCGIWRPHEVRYIQAFRTNIWCRTLASPCGCITILRFACWEKKKLLRPFWESNNKQQAIGLKFTCELECEEAKKVIISLNIVRLYHFGTVRLMRCRTLKGE